MDAENLIYGRFKWTSSLKSWKIARGEFFWGGRAENDNNSSRGEKGKQLAINKRAKVRAKMMTFPVEGKNLSHFKKSYAIPVFASGAKWREERLQNNNYLLTKNNSFENSSIMNNFAHNATLSEQNVDIQRILLMSVCEKIFLEQRWSLINKRSWEKFTKKNNKLTLFLSFHSWKWLEKQLKLKASWKLRLRLEFQAFRESGASSATD